METVKIGKQEWTSKNLDSLTFLNGDKIKIAKNAKQWQKAGEDEIPICCYYDFGREDVEKIGVYYNYYCINDSRGLVDPKFKIPSVDDYLILLQHTGHIENSNRWYFDGDNSALFQHHNLSSFSAISGGMISQWGSFFKKGKTFQAWTSTKLSELQSYNLLLKNPDLQNVDNSAVISTPYENSAGCSIRLLLNN